MLQAAAIEAGIIVDKKYKLKVYICTFYTKGLLYKTNFKYRHTERCPAVTRKITLTAVIIIHIRLIIK